MHSKALQNTVLTSLVFVAVALFAGCQYLGWALQNTVPSKIPAQYEPIDVETIILVDDPKNLLPAPQMMDQISVRMGKDLIDNDVLAEGNLIDPLLITQARIDHSDFDEWYVEDIAEQVGAKQVIHIQVVSFHLGRLDDEYRPAATVRVKVWDVVKKKRVFPSSDQTRDFAEQRVRLTSVDPAFETHTQQVALRKTLVSALANKTAKLFYDHDHKAWGTGASFNEN
jgi:hypothetical protein